MKITLPCFLRVWGMALAVGLAGCGPSAPRTTLHQAVESGNLRMVRQHIAAKSDLNKRDPSGWTALHLAVMKGDAEMVQVLTEAGADPKRKGMEGKTPVDVAREKRLVAILKLLEEAGQAPTAQQPGEKRGRDLIDGGLGVSQVLDNM